LLLAQERLSKPFWITCGHDGALLTVHFPKVVPPSDRNLLQMIATEAQFVQADASGLVWTSMERDGGGGYLAIYQRLDSSRVRKRKLKYLESATGSEASPVLSAAIEESEVSFSFTPEGATATVDGVQRVRLSVPGANGNSLVTRSEIHLGELRASVDPGLAARLAVPKGLDDLPVMTHQPDPRAAEENMDRLLLEGRSTGEILSAAARNDPDARGRLASLFRRRPESIPLAVRSLAGSAGVQAIADGLAGAGTAASIAALGAVARDVSRPDEVRVAGLVALMGIREPATEAMRIPADLIDDSAPRVRQATRLAAGALAKAGRRSHAAESDRIEAALASRFTRATTAEERNELLAALGNSAGPRVEPLLAASLKDARGEVRAAAARGLRLVPGAGADSLLVETLRKDVSPAVRDAALFAISVRVGITSALWDAVLAAARHDPADSVRNRAISLLRNHAARPPQTEAALEWIAQNDRAQAIRRYAGESLAAIRANAAAR
jgi:hypothetical protein